MPLWIEKTNGLLRMKDAGFASQIPALTKRFPLHFLLWYNISDSTG